MLRAVAVMDVPVDYGDAGEAATLARVDGGQSDVGKDAEAAPRVSLSVMSTNLLGDALRDFLDPRLRGVVE